MSRFHGRRSLLGSGRSAQVARMSNDSDIVAVQRGTFIVANGNTSGTATLGTAVASIANTRLRFLDGLSNANDTAYASGNVRIALTNTTTITGTRNGTTTDVTVGYEITEYKPGVIKQVQRGTVAATGAASGTTTITTTDVLKTELARLGSSNDQDSRLEAMSKIILTNATTVTINKSGSANTSIASFEAVEWY